MGVDISKIYPSVTRWAFLMDKAWKDKGFHPPEMTPFALSMIHKESLGNPGAHNERENAIGIGQQWAWVGKKKYHPGEPPYTHPDGKINGYKVSWNPVDQTKAIAGVVGDHMKKRTNGHLPSAWLAYASGGGTFGKFVRGDRDHPRVAYNEALIKLHDMYSAWYDGWVKAGRPVHRESVKSGEGKSFSVTLADHDVPLGDKLENPFDGKWHWRGSDRETGPVAGGGGKSASGLSGKLPALAGWGIFPTVAVTGGLTAAGLWLWSRVKKKGKTGRRRKR